MIRTFLDSGVLIDAARATEIEGQRALRFLSSAPRVYLTSPLVWLETVPKASFMRATKELGFYESFFSDSDLKWCRDWIRLEDIARIESVKHGLGATDALHVAAAHLLGADELVTTEKPGKALYRTDLVKVVALL